MIYFGKVSWNFPNPNENVLPLPSYPSASTDQVRRQLNDCKCASSRHYVHFFTFVAKSQHVYKTAEAWSRPTKSAFLFASFITNSTLSPPRWGDLIIISVDWAPLRSLTPHPIRPNDFLTRKERRFPFTFHPTWSIHRWRRHNDDVVHPLALPYSRLKHTCFCLFVHPQYACVWLRRDLGAQGDRDDNLCIAPAEGLIV